MAKAIGWLLGAAGALLTAAPAAGDYDVRVDLKNTSGEAKTDWPVVLRVYTVLGRDLPPGSVRPEGFGVYDPAGAEVPHDLQPVPPYDQPGNDELVFVIGRIEPGQTLSYRVTNTARRSGKRTRIDLAASPHNLIADGGFESGGGFAKPAEVDRSIARAGAASLKLAGDNATVSSSPPAALKLHKGSWYYLGAWSKTQGVARFGYQANGGAHVELTAPDAQGKPAPAFDGQIAPQCGTRDWLRLTFEGPVSAWGMDRYAARALADQAELKLTLRQRKHYYMAPGKTAGAWWLDELVLIEQPEVNVRFDLALAPLVQDGAMLFTRRPHTFLGNFVDTDKPGAEWCSYPYPHEKLAALDRFALKGQRVSFCVGVYHTREIPSVGVRPAGGGLTGPGGAVLPVEIAEYCPGFAGEGRDRYLKVLGGGDKIEPITLAGELGVRYFFLTFRVSPEAAPGRYDGKLEVRFGDKLRQTVPVRLRVQDLLQTAPKDVFVGIIYQGGDPPFNDEGLTVYARSGFNCLTRFGNFFDYAKAPDGTWQIDLDKLDARMRWLKGYGLTGVSVFSDLDLGPKWNGGSLLKKVRPADFNKGDRPWSERLVTAEAAWKAQIKRIEDARAKHPDWPELIYMTWDEPSLGGGVNGRPDPAMAWLNQVAPRAMTTLDVQFDPLPVCIGWYTCPAFDDPATWAGPEVYQWVRAQDKRFGFCGSAREEGDSARYQAGMLMIASEATYFHAWHLSRPQQMAASMHYDKAAGRTLRAVSMINWAAGMDDLKAYGMLRSAIEAAAQADDPARRAAAKAASDYLQSVRAVFNGDHKFTWPNEPYLGTTNDWGCEGFYDLWQEAMARHAVALAGRKWID